MMMGPREHDTMMHWGCCWKPILGKLFWLAALATLILAWVAEGAGGVYWGRTTGSWYGDALVLGVLAIGLKLAGCRHRWCAACGVKEGGQ